jgi:SAM-dependent methyltransferase
MKLNEDFTSRSKINDIGRWYITNFVQSVAGMLLPGAAVLDAGAGECAYKKYFSHCFYVSVDLAVGEENWNYQNLDCVAFLEKLPFKDAAFDAVLCTQVLEHMEWPREVVKEFYRVLKPGGKLFLTVPMAHKEHQAPYDFFRYTSFGIRSMCKHAGFNKIEISPFGGIFTRMAYELPRIVSTFLDTNSKNGRWQFKSIILRIARVMLLRAIRAAQRVFLAADRFDRVKNDPFGWSGIVEK